MSKELIVVSTDRIVEELARELAETEDRLMKANEAALYWRRQAEQLARRVAQLETERFERS